MKNKVLKSILILCSCVFIASCVSSSYTQLPSVNYSFRVKSLVMHYTAIDYQRSVDALVKEGFVSSHYLVPESNDPSYPYSTLKILQLVDETERAWHAGQGYWQGRTGLNDSSIGIEIVNVPRCFENIAAMQAAGMASRAEHGANRLCIFPDFDPKQIELVIELSRDILARNPDISPTAVVGHSDIAPSRKSDPGPRFPWYQLYQAGVGAWYDDDTLARYWQQFNQSTPNIGLLQRALGTYGYGIIETGILDQQTVDTLSAFQMHFLPWQVSGRPDSSTAAALFALLEKYFPDAIEQLMQRYETESLASSAIMPLTKNDSLLSQLASKGLFVDELLQGQVNSIFPLQRSDKREKVNNRARFRAYAGSGSIHVQSLGAESADIYVNEQKLNITQPFALDEHYEYSLAKRTRTGLNSLRVENIVPANASLYIHIPFPEIIANDNSRFDFSKVDHLIEQDIENGFPGAVLLVLHKGQIIKHSAYGSAQKYDSNGELLITSRPMSVDTRFDLASNTKVFATTLAIMKLVDEGKIALDNSVSNYLPEYSGEGREGRSVADLLAHASGYNSEVKFFRADNPLGESFHSLDASVTKDLLLTKLPFTNGRQTQQTYSDTNFMILGLLVERVTGMALDEYVEQQIYRPLGLESLQFNPLNKGKQSAQYAATEIRGNSRGGNVSFPGIREHVLAGEVHDEKAFYSMHGVAGHAGLFGNAKDLALLSQLLLNEGGYANTSLFSNTTLSRFVTPRYRKNSMGLGWRLAADDSLAWHFGPYASNRAFGHTGWTGTATLIDPEYDLAIILLTNKKHSPVTSQSGELTFEGDAFETGRYGSVMSLVYEAVFKGVN
ncbi:penicillin binding protein PBP4B [Glaciecola sp. SC05]|uniref:penicillin binding protein PBP4B n=1 Tax=Glaciecola sp. SC05 TaxID=1987355 RepID=UPI0035272159